MNTEVEVQENLREKIKLDKAYINYHKIIDKNLPYKFSYLDEWTLKKSKKLLEEAEQFENCKENKFRTYKRGTIIKADFGVGLGSEMSQVHFAIVLNNYDNPKNNVLTVIPLTSKKSRFNLDLGTLVIQKFIDKINCEIVNIGKEEELSEHKNITLENEIKLKKLSTLLSYYKSNVKNTFACPNLITTISKTRVFKAINEYDIVGKEKCSNEVMDIIDDSIARYFTNIKKNVDI